MTTDSGATNSGPVFMYGLYSMISGRKTTDVGRVLTDATKFQLLTYVHHSTVFWNAFLKRGRCPNQGCVPISRLFRQATQCRS